MTDLRTETFVIKGDGVTTVWDFGVPVRNVVGVKLGENDPQGMTVSIRDYRQTERGVTFNPPLVRGEVVTVYFYSDFL